MRTLLFSTVIRRVISCFPSLLYACTVSLIHTHTALPFSYCTHPPNTLSPFLLARDSLPPPLLPPSAIRTSSFPFPPTHLSLAPVYQPRGMWITRWIMERAWLRGIHTALDSYLLNVQYGEYERTLRHDVCRGVVWLVLMVLVKGAVVVVVVDVVVPVVVVAAVVEM